MRHERFTPMEYRNERLMDDFNEMMIRIKKHLFDIPIQKPKPTIQELDEIFRQIMAELKKDATPLIRR
jgi:hypothetical protein